MIITGKPALEEPAGAMIMKIDQLSSTIEDLRRQITNMVMTLYVAVAMPAIGIVIRAMGIFSARKK